MADTEKIIKCPACGKEMKKVYIQDAGLNIDICTEGCGGMLFDNRELEKISAGDNTDAVLAEVQGKEYTSVNEDKSRICPVCGTIMVKMGAGNGGVKIDVCNVCGAKYLDYGELEKIKSTSSEKYEDSPQNKIMMEKLEREASAEAIGPFGRFIQANIKATGYRESVEKFFRKYV